jgi:hypothetical protein
MRLLAVMAFIVVLSLASASMAAAAVPPPVDPCNGFIVTGKGGPHCYAP